MEFPDWAKIKWRDFTTHVSAKEDQLVYVEYSTIIKKNQERIKPGEWIYPYVGTDDV